MKKLLIGILKIGISVGILAYLVVQAQRNAVFSDLASRPKQWDLLAAAAGVCFLAVGVTFVRWYYLVRALELPFQMRDALRMGFLGYLFNLAPMGIVGGDLLKAVMLARVNQGSRAKAVATVFVDRVIGLYVLFVVASVAILATGLWQVAVDEVRWVCRVTLGLAVLGTIAVAIPLLPDVTNGKSIALAERLPYVGPQLRRLIEAVQMYRLRLPVLAASAAMSVAVHLLFALGVYLIALGLYDQVHPLGTQCVVVPLSSATGVVPLTLGPFELVLNELYADIPLPDGGNMAKGQGLVVALGYRIITVLIAAVGFCYYLAARREVATVMRGAEEDSRASVAEAA